MTLNFNSQGNDKQREAYGYWADDITTNLTYGGGKGGGKSYLGCALIGGDALMYPNTHYFIARKTLNDLRKFTRPSMQEVMENWGISNRYYKFNGQDNFFEFYNDSKIFLLEAKYMPSDPLYQRFGSMQMTRTDAPAARTSWALSQMISGEPISPSPNTPGPAKPSINTIGLPRFFTFAKYGIR